MKKKAAEVSAVRDKHKIQYEKALGTLIDRVDNNAYIDRRRNIFCVWAEYVKKERNCLNAVYAIGRKYMKLEVFARIRRLANENALEDNAERTITNFARMFKQGNVKKAFSKWRRNAYQMCVAQLNETKSKFSGDQHECSDKMV
jgi:hypothetical protein